MSRTCIRQLLPVSGDVFDGMAVRQRSSCCVVALFNHRQQTLSLQLITVLHCFIQLYTHDNKTLEKCAVILS